jgi:hypothetical protein
MQGLWCVVTVAAAGTIVTIEANNLAHLCAPREMVGLMGHAWILQV